MEITKTNENQVTIVKIIGSMDALTAPELTAYLTQEIEAGNIHIVADMSGLDYTSSAGLRALLGTVKLARQQGGDLRLASVQPKVLKVLELSGFTNILKHFSTTTEAVSSFE